MTVNKITIGLLFIAAGVMYGSLALDGIYQHTLGYLVKNNWVSPPKGKLVESFFGRKTTILTYSLILIALGLYIIFKLD